MNVNPHKSLKMSLPALLLDLATASLAFVKENGGRFVKMTFFNFGCRLFLKTSKEGTGKNHNFRNLNLNLIYILSVSEIIFL